MPKRWLPLAVLFALGLGLGVVLLAQSAGDRGEPELVQIEPKVDIVPGIAEAGPRPTADIKPGIGISRLVMPRFGIDAAIVVLGVDSDGVMQAPEGPSNVGWYNFSSLPGQGKNIVVSGHVDYINVGPAVFWRLREAHEDDVVQLLLEDQSVVTYRLVSIKDYDADNAPVQEIIGPTEAETLTMITCGGTFNTKTRQYDKRLILRAIRS